MTTIVDALLRDPDDVVRRCRRPDAIRPLALTSLLCLCIGAIVFGGVVGSFRGGLQIPFSAVKLPLALFGTLVVCVPAFYALVLGFGGNQRFTTVAALTLAASGRAALVLVGFAPLLWLAKDWGLGYHGLVLLASSMYLTSGVAAIFIVLRGLRGSVRALATSAVCAFVFFGVLGQTAWMLRPFFGRPAQQSVPFIRPREGSFADAVVTSGRSAFDEGP